MHIIFSIKPMFIIRRVMYCLHYLKEKSRAHWLLILEVQVPHAGDSWHLEEGGGGGGGRAKHRLRGEKRVNRNMRSKEKTGTLWKESTGPDLSSSKGSTKNKGLRYHIVMTQQLQEKSATTQTVFPWKTVGGKTVGGKTERWTNINPHIQ